MRLQLRPRAYDHPDVSVLVQAVQDEYRVLYGGPDEGRVDLAELAPPTGWFCVGYLDGAPVAMGGWRRLDPAPYLPSDRTAELKRMYVVPSARRAGHARRLLAVVEESAARAGMRWLVLETGQMQQPAIALYRSSGYTDVDGRFGHYHDSPLAVYLGKPLPPPD